MEHRESIGPGFAHLVRAWRAGGLIGLSSRSQGRWWGGEPISEIGRTQCGLAEKMIDMMALTRV